MFKFLSSIHLAVILLIFLIAACILGTVVIQSSGIHTQTEEEARNFYIKNNGETIGKIIYNFELHNVFYSKWFIGLLFLFVVNIFFCGLNNWSFSLIKIGFLLTHSSIIIILIGSIIGKTYGDKGFFWLSAGEKSNEYISMKNGRVVKLPFTIILKNFELKFYNNQSSRKGAIRMITGAGEQNYNIDINSNSEFKSKDNKFSVKIVKYFPDFTFDMQTRSGITQSENPNNPALQVEISNGSDTEKRYLFALHHDFMPGVKFRDIIILFHYQPMVSDYISHLKVQTSSGIIDYDLKVNHPLSIAGYKLYQSSYDQKTLAASGIEVVKDPGLPFIYAGFVLLTAGIFFIFYIKPYIKRKYQ